MPLFDDARASLARLTDAPPGADRSDAVEDFMAHTYAIGLELGRNPSLRTSDAFRAYVQESARRLVPYSHWLDTYVLRTMNILDLSFEDQEWIRICERRSALEFLREMSIGTDFEVAAALVDVEKLNARIMDRGETEGHLPAERIPAGLTDVHWWWWYPNPPTVSGDETTG